LFADYASNERARMHANPKFQVNIVIATKFTKGLLHAQSQVSNVLCMICDAAFQSRSDHIGIANGFYLLGTMLFGKFVEP